MIPFTCVAAHYVCMTQKGALFCLCVMCTAGFIPEANPIVRARWFVWVSIRHRLCRKQHLRLVTLRYRSYGQKSEEREEGKGGGEDSCQNGEEGFQEV